MAHAMQTLTPPHQTGSNGQRLSVTSSVSVSGSGSSYSNNTDTATLHRTLPRKRRPRAVGEVYITSPASRLYLNGEPSAPLEPLSEPIYQNEAAAISQRCCYAQQRCQRLTVARTQNGDRKDPTKESMVVSTFVDDSDHYYETLSPLGNKRHSTQLEEQRTPTNHNQDLPRYVSNGVRASQRQGKKHSASAHALGEHVPNSDDYDSFESDTDEHYEQDERLRHHNDSGVDIRNHRLPDPPAPQKQVYAIVRKFRDFISNKKSPKGAGKYGGSQQKLYENTTQFYVESGSCLGQSSGNLYEKSQNRKKTNAKKLANHRDDIYDNTEFHKMPATNLSNSEKNLLANANRQETTNSATLLRNKQKNTKSLRSRLRKSLVGVSFDTKQLSTLTSTRSTFYIEDPVQSGSGELDSGFSEKASSGDIPVQPTEVPSAESQKFATVARKSKKEAKAHNAQRRRTTIGIRPHEPPPPPPEDKQGDGANKTPTTSWYAECGVFKQSTEISQLPLLNENHSELGGKAIAPSHSGSSNGHTSGGNSWYTESGLYQTSGVSVASSSGSSGVSTGNEAGLGDELPPHSLFLNEPLYQIYSAAKLESITRDLEDHESSTDGYEEIGQHSRTQKEPTDSLKRSNDSNVRKSTRPTALQLVEPKNGPSRTLWSEIPEVTNSGILPTLTPRERGLQEAKFEIITSEASYLKSLNLLRRHFMNNVAFCDTSVLSSRDRKALFSYIVPVHECSERLLTELESCWQDNIMLLGLSHRIYAIAERYFHVYISFCEHQGRMDRTLRHLKSTKGVFQQQLVKLETSPHCCGLNLLSFLMLPMQRITRLPLLIDAVFSKVSPHDDEYESWKMTLAIMNKIVTQCNEAANRCEQAYELERISKQLEFPSYIRALAIAPVGVPKQGAKPRFLVKRGELTHIMCRGDDAKLTFGKRFTKSSIYAFLFSDLLVLTKRKGESQFSVFDYCPRSLLTIASDDSLPQLPTKDIKDQTGKNLILMTLLENYEGKTVELVLSCPSVSDQQRWLQAMRPPEAETPGEKLYESWDCPQVIAKHSYESDEPDVLNLELGDVVNVSRKLPDGWYQGERIRDGAVGWFPGSYTEEVNSAHVRARNLKQRYRLLTFTATYLELQKRK
ncbi:rho guanine nucleotide exchange factor 5 isoform X2 [Scaptodrosophila lebanonensis]|uniref:Rho guanine nucleotide exchange factor 5 isoform X2 n=1 Tax=Drosophila lebanonensis TaxID=7225 RepID=A0A6J2UAL8_DROLE|nr:rho guanine nucleotide exchange factor 5 isoform X2 [Scaptodrosophila lebanonensis]XP_030385066.1 rho guanine nucleotide exchange factor 5 isoform X2 [Scaptodrosophila lebanonensis]